MKFSITLLSSILAVCSVTIANPVDSSSTTSTEASTLSASPSATKTAEPTSVPDSLYGDYSGCHLIDSEGVVLIKILVEYGKTADILKQEMEEKRIEIEIQRQKVKTQRKEFDALESEAEESNDAENYGPKIAELELGIEGSREILRKLRKQYWDLDEEFDGLKERLTEFQMKILKYFLDSDGSTTLTINDFPRLESVPGFTECLGEFYSGSLQSLSQSGYEETM
ncbi:hypothetical protein O5D80_002446 [Batrachochytrium dendrobatidis]|nr:hypothetical protein O5D80_002446 [Batrachochytrium dendrobatidis]